MAIFLDTGVIVAARNADDKKHEKAKDLMRSALRRDYGTAYTSDYIFDEAVTLMLMRTKNPDLALDVGEFVLRSSRITKLRVSRDDFMQAWSKFKTLKKELLSFTDCTSLVLMDRNKIEEIMSFDSDFDGLIARRH